MQNQNPVAATGMRLGLGLVLAGDQDFIRASHESLTQPGDFFCCQHAVAIETPPTNPACMPHPPLFDELFQFTIFSTALAILPGRPLTALDYPGDFGRMTEEVLVENPAVRSRVCQGQR